LWSIKRVLFLNDGIKFEILLKKKKKFNVIKVECVYIMYIKKLILLI
jgi:hypothetical protein